MAGDGLMSSDDRSEELAASSALEGTLLEPPLRRVSSLSVDEWTVRRMWDGVQRKLQQRRARTQRRVLAWAVVVGACLGIAVWVIALPPGLGGRAEPGVAQMGPLLTRDARPFESLEAAPGDPPARVELADGSAIEAAPGARVESVAASADEFAVLVRRGRARFSVTPGGPRRWLIQTRSARVEVVGTVLSVESGVSEVRVAVEKGAVLVRAAELPDGVQRLGAGEALTVRDGDGAEGARPEAVAPAVAELAEQADAEARAVSELGRREARRGARTPRADGGTGPRAARSARVASARAAELLERADAARRKGDAAGAAALLSRLLREQPRDAQAPLAAFTLGVLQLEQLDLPAEAARRFRQALDLGIAESLRESCYVRWAEALDAAGDGAALRAVVGEYVRHYPNGRARRRLEQLDGSGEARP